MKVIGEGEPKSQVESVAVLFQKTFLSGPALMFRKGRDKESVIVFSDLTGGGGYDWDEQLSDAKVLKYYYPGDRITIEV